LNTGQDEIRKSRLERTMRVSVTEAKRRLSELVRCAGAGDEVILTRHGKAVVRLAPIEVTPNGESRRVMIKATCASARTKAAAGPDAARSQDFLYGDDGLPG
jgi:prevent-host-death family protein